MEKKFTRSKIIILSIAILVTILTFSIGIFGIIEKNKKDEQTKVKGATEYYLIKKDAFYNRPTGDEQIKTKMEYSTLTYYSKSEYTEDWNNPIFSVYFTGVTNYDNDYYDITNASITSCNVYNDWGLSYYNAFKSAGQVSFYGRYKKTDTFLGLSDEDNPDKLMHKSFSSSYNLIGTINIEVDGVVYEKSYHHGNGLTYQKGDDWVLSASHNSVEIYDKYGLKLFAQEWADTVCTSNDILRGKSVSLKADMDMSGMSMTPIGTSSIPFNGTFDGKGYTIKNLPMCKTYNYKDTYPGYYENFFGLFSVIDGATIQNLYIDNAKWNNTMESSSLGLHAGILVGKSKGNSTIKNCYVYDSELKIYDNTSTYTYIIYGTVENEVIESQSSQGGLVGRVDNSGTLNISNCGVLVNMDSIGINNIGGYIGSSGDNTIITIKNSYYKGSIKGQVLNGAWDAMWIRDMYFGGLVGGKDSTLSAENCYVSIQNVEMLNGEWYDGAGGNSAGDHRYSEYCVNLKTNKNNKIYVKSSTLKYYYEGNFNFATLGTKNLDRQVELLTAELF